MAWVATAIVGSAVIGGISQSYAASKAADAQKAGADKAIAFQQDQYQQTRADLSPYRDMGTKYAAELDQRMPELTSDISVNPQDFLNSDYYKFLEKQGQRTVTNSSAVRGLGSSGALIKGALEFSKGLNSQEWQNNFNMQNTNRKNAYDRLKGLIDTGAAASTATGTLGEKAAYNSGTAAVGAGNAEAAADNKIGAAIANTASGIGGYAAYQGLYGNNPSGRITTGGPNGPTPFA